MFGFSLGEVLLILLISMVLLGPTEMFKVAANIRTLVSKLQNWYQQYYNELMNKDNAAQEITKYIIDMDGNVQQTYDLSKIMPDLKPNKPLDAKDEET